MQELTMRTPAGLRPLPGSWEGSAGETLILVVDDSLVDRHVAGSILEKHKPWKAAYASNGVEALAAIERKPPRVVLTDMQMPEMDGLTLVKEIRERYPHIPVILMTGTGSEQVAVQALRTGAASYVPKRALASSLMPALEQVVAASHLEVHRRKMLECLTQRVSRFAVDNDPALIPPLVALLQEDLIAMNLCDATGATRAGVALQEALLDALYRGNLEISPDLRRQGDETIHLAEQRRRLPPYCHRRIRVFATVTPEEAVYVIFDQGPGVSRAALADANDADTITNSGARGLLLMRTFMDRVTYNTGNQVTLVKRREQRG
jgi:CheY-like chemotaxis protein/anti-sigma regulatory factor (Ser/Thr protein kinase)